MATLLLELFSEEIPSRMQRGATEQLHRLITAGFDKAGLAYGDVKTFVSPRHLAIQVHGLPLVQPDVSEEKKGPKVGAPEQAMKGFLNSVGLTADQCEQRDGYYFAVIHKKGRPVSDVAKEVCEKALNDFVWPKSMKWGARAMQWVRPLHRIVALLDDKIVPVAFGHLKAADVTEGHRFLSSGTITIKNAESYVEQLKAANVVVDAATRRDWIGTEVSNLAKRENLEVVNDPALLDEVTGLVEWPVPLIGTFDASFLSLPPEVLISEMKVHQRYFALRDASGNLTNRFIAVANMITADEGKRVIEGNARVLRARLSDGAFYWEQDKKTSLEDWGKKLADVVFHAKVGMLDKKVARIENLAAQIATAVGYTDAKQVQRAAKLAKADLTSGMVGEFPDLQGIMGRYYATAQGETQEVADAIRDHYKPLGANDSVPESQLAAIIAVADKLDSITALFSMNEKPTGSKDPLALRRAALGILRIIIENRYSIDLKKIISFSLIDFSNHKLEALKKQSVEKLETALAEMSFKTEEALFTAKQELLKKADKINIDKGSSYYSNTIVPWTDDVTDFFRDRLKTMLKDEGVRHDIIEASFSVSDGSFNPLAIVANAKALSDFTTKQQVTLAAIKRALNILAAEEKKAKTNYSFAAAKAAAFAKPAEQELHNALQQKIVSLDALAGLASPINKFFDDVLVTEEGFKDQRLSLLAGVRETTSRIADFSKIEG